MVLPMDLGPLITILKAIFFKFVVMSMYMRPIDLEVFIPLYLEFISEDS